MVSGVLGAVGVATHPVLLAVVAALNLEVAPVHALIQNRLMVEMIAQAVRQRVNQPAAIPKVVRPSMLLAVRGGTDITPVALVQARLAQLLCRRNTQDRPVPVDLHLES
jgi:hypothetical protein